MKILYIVHPARRNTATYNHMREVAGNLERLGHEVSRVNLANMPETKSKLVKSLLLLWWEMRLLRVLLHRTDVVYSRHRWLNLAEILHKRPYIREINGFVADETRIAGNSRLVVWLFNRIERWNLKRSSRWIAVTERIKKTLVEEYGVPEEKVTVVVNGANTELFRPMNHPRWVMHNDRICFVGQLWEHQKLERVISALKKHLPQVQLFIIGDGPLMESLRSWNVTMVGRVPQEEVPLYISQCSICVGPFTEGSYNNKIGRSALKLSEYLACGKPVVCSRTEGTEFIEQEGLGVLVDDLKPKTIADAVNYLLERPELRVEMGKRAREWAVENANWAKVAERISEVLEGVRE